MKKLVLAGLSAFGVGMFAAPASAAIVDAKCVSVKIVDGGCLFTGNDNDVPGIEAEYNATGKPEAPISLSFITKSDAGDFGDFGSITGDGTTDGTWSLPGYLVDFISVKAGNFFLLYKLDAPASSGSWSTLGIEVGGGQQPNLSHVSFFGGEGAVVPEPATWAMLIAGFGLVGSALRRRKGVASVAA